METSDCRPHRRRRHADTAGNLADRYVTRRPSRLAHVRSLCRHPLPPSANRRSGPETASRDTRPLDEIIPEWRARSFRNGGRDHLGMVDDFIPEPRAASRRNPHVTWVHGVSMTELSRRWLLWVLRK